MRLNVMRPRKKRIRERTKMKREDITNLFPDATTEQIKALMNINGNDINNARRGMEELQRSLTETQGALAQAQESANELQTEKDRANELQKELDAMKTADAIRTTREKVAQNTGVPVHLLTGETEDDCNSQAEAILAFAQPSGYPNVRDNGEVTVRSKKSAAEQFAEWSEQFF